MQILSKISKIFKFVYQCTIGVFSQPSQDFVEMLKDLKFDERCKKTVSRKLQTLVSDPSAIHSADVTRIGKIHSHTNMYLVYRAVSSRHW